MTTITPITATTFTPVMATANTITTGPANIARTEAAASGMRQSADIGPTAMTGVALTVEVDATEEEPSVAAAADEMVPEMVEVIDVEIEVVAVTVAKPM